MKRDGPDFLAGSAFGLLKLARKLRNEGACDDEILRVFRTQLALKRYHRYSSRLPLHGLGWAVQDLLYGEESVFLLREEMEKLFYERLVRSGLSYKERIRIGCYKIPYLIEHTVVVDMGNGDDEGLKDRRVKYLNGRGITVLRVPEWLMALSPETVIEKIHAQLKERQSTKADA